MLEKRTFPLNNPPQEKSINNVNRSYKVNNYVVNDGARNNRGDSKGGKERTSLAEAILRCPHCGHNVKIVFPCGKPPEWTRCARCGELQPTDGYHVIMYGLGLPNVLSSEEIRVRQQAIAKGEY